MEYWNAGIMKIEGVYQYSITPSLHYSTIL